MPTVIDALQQQRALQTFLAPIEAKLRSLEGQLLNDAVLARMAPAKQERLWARYFALCEEWATVRQTWLAEPPSQLDNKLSVC